MDRSRLESRLRDFGCDAIAFDQAVPVGDDLVVPVECAENLPARAAGEPLVRAVHPNSDIELYG